MTVAATLASCAGHDVLSDEDIRGERADQVMAFSVLSTNLGRATAMEAAGHTDFGVFAYKGTGTYWSPEYPGDLVMQNYQVKYGAAEVLGSHWYYEGARTGQILKYWDYSKPSHYFAAYTPYNSNSTFEISEWGSILTTMLELKGMEAFYLESDRDDKETMYAQAKVDKSAYGQEVNLTFNHLNALIRLAFRSAIPGYKVELLNLVSEDGLVTVGGGQAAAVGVQLTPATTAEAAKPVNFDSGGSAAPQPALSQKYPYKEDIKVSGLFTGTAPSVTAANYNTTCTDDNIVFPLNDTDAGVTAFPISDTSDYTPLRSQYFALPLDDYHEPYLPGFTVHVTYRLIPNDGTASTTVYDARVFIPAEKCQWTFGKQYLYRFTITTGSTGVTNPNTPVYDDGSTASPYVDPRDPRVPDTKALLPIVFDGVTVNSYSTETIHYENIN
ncbi:MAG: fimbrillin family protein [Muribaculaceae bacterium]